MDFKTRRLSDGQPARVLDLFSGCGGLSLGFQRAGFQIVGHVEMDKAASRSHALNFHPTQMGLHARPRDITALEPDELCAELGLGERASAVDIIIGGPPCQAYARVGRAKLRQVADNPRAFQDDARRNLYLSYLHYVEWFQPLALVFENVPDILNQEGQNVVQGIVERLSALGYDSRYSLLNASHYGVPQTRDRVFIVAFRQDLRASIRFPQPTHHCALPSGYANSRSHALSVITRFPDRHAEFVPGVQSDVLPPAVTAMQALGDLPFLTGSTVTRQSQKLGTPSLKNYTDGVSVSDYARRMREWPGFETFLSVTDHVTRRQPRDGRIFARMPQGSEYPAALAIAEGLFREAVAGASPMTETELSQFHARYVPPYDPKKFANKWWKLRSDAPARTLMAHLGKDGYSHIHYDSAQARTITVREAARLQSFPDGFQFAGSMNDAFRQIGNAVPPLMSACVAEAVKDTLAEVVGRRTESMAA